MDIYKSLETIQRALKVPKNQRNNFGGYNYRSCEDILEAVKPHLEKTHCTLTLSDALEQIGDRYYIKATATLRNDEGAYILTMAYAREAESKKGSDESQITGACSSYARKYALNGLFCIDDVKDADATNTHDKEPEAKEPETKEPETKEKPKKLATPKQISIIEKLITDKDAMFKYYGISNIAELTMEQASAIILQKSKKKETK